MADSRSNPDPSPADAAAWVGTAYEELHALARRHLGVAGAHTLQPTALIHEAYLKLAAKDAAVRDRAHFAALASRVMRQILVDHARAKIAARRGGERDRVSISGLPDETASPDYDVLALDEALRELQELNATKARLVELRFFAGLTESEAADALGMSRAEATRQWRVTRAWLAQRLRGRTD